MELLKIQNQSIEKLIEISGNFSDEFDEKEKTDIGIDDSVKKALRILAEELSADKRTRRHTKHDISDCKIKQYTAKRLF